MNARSSRGHTILQLTMAIVENSGTENLKKKFSQLNLVDLAGSERVGQTNSEGKRLEEAKVSRPYMINLLQNINKSLFFLEKVIMEIVKKSTKKLPKDFQPTFSESVLTRLLSNSLGGNAKTTLLVTASTRPEDYE